jgi:CheY-like chemotaxis protein
MADTILIATSDLAAQRDLAQLLDVATPHIFTSDDGQNLLAQIRQVKPRLVIVDVSLPTISGYEICRMIKEDRSFVGVPVVLLAGEKQFNRDESHRVHADSLVQWPSDDPYLVNLARNKLLRFLLADRPGKTWSQQTYIILDLMAHRAAAILAEELVERMDFSVTDSETNVDVESVQFGTLIDKTFQGLLSKSDFTAVLASRYLEELPQLLWVEVGEQLIVSHLCAVSEFGSFGIYGAGSELKVTFDAEPTLIDNVLPQIKIDERMSSFAATKMHLSIGEIVTRELFPYLMEKGSPGSGMEISHNALRDTLGPILMQLRANPEVIQIGYDWTQTWSGLARRADLLGALGRAGAYTTYFGFIVGFARSLHEAAGVEIETFGTFLRERGSVGFSASDSFLQLLRANLYKAGTANA